MSHTTSTKPQLIARIRRITGQMQAIEQAVAAEVGCTAVLQQVAAARGAINGLLDQVVEDHLREHVAHPGLDDAARAAGVEELVAVIRRYSK